MKNRRMGIALGLIFAAMLAVVSCGGGHVAGGGTGGTGMSMGTVSGFGSVFVNGIEYETNDATTITVDGVTVSSELEQYRQVLALGMVVKVDADRRGAIWIANSIEYRSELIGPVENLSAEFKTFELLGATVTITADTTFAGLAGFSELSLGPAAKLVKVAGFANPGGGVTATRIYWDGETTWTSGVTPVARRGVAAGPTATGFYFDHADTGLAVEYSGDPAPADGAYVRVVGTYDGTRLVATSVEIEDRSFGRDGSEFEIEGIITAMPSATQIVVNGYTFDVTGAEIEAPLALGDRVEVEGTVKNGVAVVEEVEQKHESEMELLAQVESVNATANPPYIVMVGRSFEVTVNTAIEEKATFLQGLSAGDWVKVHAYQTGPTTYVVTEAEVRDPGALTLSGPVTATSSNIFTIGGFDVLADGASYSPPLTGFSSIHVGDDLDVVMNYDGSTFQAVTISQDD